MHGENSSTYESNFQERIFCLHFALAENRQNMWHLLRLHFWYLHDFDLKPQTKQCRVSERLLRTIFSSELGALFKELQWKSLRYLLTIYFSVVIVWTTEARVCAEYHGFVDGED